MPGDADKDMAGEEINPGERPPWPPEGELCAEDDMRFFSRVNNLILGDLSRLDGDCDGL